jgi:hypothetical protein
LTRSCKAIFQRRLPLKKKDPESFNSIGKLSIKEAQCNLGEGINSIPTWVIGKLKSIQAQPSTVNLTLAEGSIKNPDGVVSDVMVQEEKPASNFGTSKTQNKTHLLQESQWHLRRTSTYSRKAKIGAREHLLLLAKFMEFLLNKRKRKDDVFFLSYKPP